MQKTILNLIVIPMVLFLNVGCLPLHKEIPVTGNPLLAGYFADPTICKFGDTYYIYATTDGIKLASGEPQVWISYDFVNWNNYEMDIDLPEGLTNCWAPDVLQGKDGRFYYFMGNCQFGCNIYGYVSNTPVGPWKPINDGKPVIPVGTSKENLPALDAQFFQDDNGDIYAYFGTWCTSFGGMGWAKMNPNDFSIEKTGFIPIDQIPEAFEAAYMIKYDSIYYLMYSAGDCRLSSYAVHYAWSMSPEGPFIYGENNPILETNDDGTIDGPGHHSILKEDDEFFILYHRHDNPHSSGGEFRQVCMDKLSFEGSCAIKKVIPTHSGVKIPLKSSLKFTDLAMGAKTSASSFYHLKSMATRYSNGAIDFQYLPSFAVDNNNGTMWKAASATLPQSLIIDLGEKQSIKRIATHFEYPTFYYQYKLEVSNDSSSWKIFADQTANRRSGSPMIDDNEMVGRFIKLIITGTEKSGMIPAVWNIGAYSKRFITPPYKNMDVVGEKNAKSTNSLLIDFDASLVSGSSLTAEIENLGSLNGNFIPVGKPVIRTINNVKSIFFDGKSFLKLNKYAPKSLDWNSPFTACVWVYNPEVGSGECLLAWNSRKNMLQSSYAALMYGTGNYGAMAHGDGAVDLSFSEVPEKGQWHCIMVTFDGMLESVYVDGVLNTQMPLNLFVKSDEILIGASGSPIENFTGYIARIQLYDKALSKNEIQLLLGETLPDGLGFFNLNENIL